MGTQVNPNFRPKLKPREVHKCVKPLPGWCTYREGNRLYRMAAMVEQGAIVELGSYYGKSSIWLGYGARSGSGAPVYAVDSWEGRPEGTPFTGPEPLHYGNDVREAWRGNIEVATLGDIVSGIQGWHVEVGRSWTGGPVGFLFVDGDHTYEGTRAAFEAWRPHLLPRALLAFHDYGPVKYPGVVRYVNELHKRGVFDFAGTSDSLAYGRLSG